MMQSLVDYVLERGNRHFGEFAHKPESETKSALFNHRKLLQHLFQDNEASPFRMQTQKRISDLKHEEISGQLNYFSEKMHAELNKKYLSIDEDLYRVENEWIRKKIPDFYCYYFLKFAYANTYKRMHELFLSELEHMGRERDSYAVVRKTIEARQSCLVSLRKQINAITELEVQQCMQILREQRKQRRKKQIANNQAGYKKKNREGSDEQVGKSWRNKLENIFQLMSHFRKLTAYVVELIKNWKAGIYAISEDPRRFRERVIFYHHDANYLLKMILDNRFVFDSFLAKLMSFASHYDPFFLRPCMVFEKKGKLTTDEEIIYSLIKPNDFEMDKMLKALVVLAEEEYDEDEQSKFLDERRNYGQLEQRKQFIERRREVFNSASQGNLKAAAKQSPQKQRITPRSPQESANGKQIQFTADKKSDNTMKEVQQIRQQQKQKAAKNTIETTLNRIKKIRSVDLKKISPYLNRNQRLAKAQKVIEIEHKFRVAQNQYVQTLKKTKEQQPKTSSNNKSKPKQKQKQKQELDQKAKTKQQWSSTDRQIINNKIFNKYIEQNLRMMEEANQKAYVYKNKVSPTKRQAVAQDINYNKISFRQRKQVEYERNLESYQRIDRSYSQSGLRQAGQPRVQKNLTSNGTRPIIEISSKGIRSNQSIIDYELTGKKGKNVGAILNKAEKAEQMRMIEMRLNPKGLDDKQNNNANLKDQPMSVSMQMSKSQIKNLFESEQKPEIVIMRQQPEKIEEIKQFLYVKIKQQLIEQMKRNSQEKDIAIGNMIEQQKRRKIQQIMEQRRLEEQRRKQEEQNLRSTQLAIERKKIDTQIRVEPIQYSEENIGQFYDKIFDIHPQTFHRMFLNEKIEQKKSQLLDQFYTMILRGFARDEQTSFAIIRYDWRSQGSRKLVIDYMVARDYVHYMSSFHQFCEYLWRHDPVQQIELVVMDNQENQEGKKVNEDLQEYANRRGETFERALYSNVRELKYVWTRPKQYERIGFGYTEYYFGKLVNLKCQLMSSAMNLNERITPKIDMNLEIFTNYIFLLEELFRKYLTPEEIVELRENSTNIRRLKDIFRIVLELEKTNPAINELTVVEGLNLDDMYQKLKQKVKPPYKKYHWQHFYDKTLSNRILLSILEFKLQLEFPVNSCMLDDRRFFKINPRRKVLTLRSSVYSKQPIYILNTSNKKIRMFIMDAEAYKLMRIQLFVFLNLVFNNIVEDSEKFVNSFWVPQFVVNSDSGKQVKRITDFSITMKKSFFLSEEIYLANYEYIKNSISFLPKKSDIIFGASVVVGFLHTDIEASSTGMPIYAKMIDRGQMFNQTKGTLP